MDSDRKNNLSYNKKLQPLAHKLRYKMTKAEACLWKYALRAHQMNEYQFRRQRPVLNYIADFMCKELKLIIEVDGITHMINDATEKDEFRQKELEKEGFVVLRFTDEEVLTRINDVRNKISKVINEIESK